MSSDTGDARGAHGTATTNVAVELLTKRFGAVTALSGVSLEFKAGQVHALLGANGSGKSTLVKILSGAQPPTSGTIYVGGERRTSIDSPTVATELGISVVYQEAPLIDTLSVLESVAVFRGYGAHGLGRVPWRRLRRETAQLLERTGVKVDLNALCSQISAADRASVSLAVALAHEPQNGAGESRGLLIIDEATASIPDKATDLYLQRIRKVADQGLAVLIITHRLAELRIADDITVLRGGSVVFREAGRPRPGNDELIDLLVGEDLSHARPVLTGASASAGGRRPVSALWGYEPPASPSPDEDTEALRLDGIRAGDLDGFDFVGKPGDVVGFVGSASGGLRDIPAVLSGRLRTRAGSITVGGKRLHGRMTPAQMIHAGVMVVPSDRLHDGGVPSLSAEENVTLPDLKRYWHHPALSKQTVERVIDSFEVRPRNPRVLFGSLSGGNQQKVLLGKWLTMRPKVLVVDDPTYGVDPGARQIIFAAIRDAAAHGVCVLFLSTEPELMLQVCTRVVVVRDGVMSGRLSGSDLTPANLAEWSY